MRNKEEMKNGKGKWRGEGKEVSSRGKVREERQELPASREIQNKRF